MADEVKKAKLVTEERTVAVAVATPKRKRQRRGRR
jgi:hypothetical protein